MDHATSYRTDWPAPAEGADFGVPRPRQSAALRRRVQGEVACFVAGTRIATQQGLIAVEALEPGDMIRTLDHGPQPLRQCIGRTVASQGAFAAISIPAGTFGLHGALRISPLNRLLIADWQTDLGYAGDDLMVEAGLLARAGVLRQDHSGCPVTYYHLVFDRHETICAEGLWSESFRVGKVVPQDAPAAPEP